ncbi:hypothetical protein [Martelella soudanensis]|uniref:hypothetical protein n=1 Tax=unclassified Martelella TaxID=2629616 RepID=UPI0015DDCD3A|nr:MULTISPECIES: hypothetical protein [unclassified Martelella]
MTNYHSTLKEAVEAAFIEAQENIDGLDIDAANHLMAQRRVYGDGSTGWAVRFSDSFDSDWMTHLYDSARDCAGNVDEVVKRISSDWDENWDEIQEENAAGDFSLGSSDFVTRSH